MQGEIHWQMKKLIPIHSADNQLRPPYGIVFPQDQQRQAESYVESNANVIEDMN